MPLIGFHLSPPLSVQLARFVVPAQTSMGKGASKKMKKIKRQEDKIVKEQKIKDKKQKIKAKTKDKKQKIKTQDKKRKEKIGNWIKVKIQGCNIVVKVEDGRIYAGKDNKRDCRVLLCAYSGWGV